MVTDARIKSARTAFAAKKNKIADAIKVEADVNYVDPAHAGKRRVVGVFLTLATAVVGSYQAVVLASYMWAGAMLLSGSAFIGWCATILVLLLAIQLTLTAASRVGEYVAAGQLEIDMRRAKRWVGNVFSSKKEVSV